MPRKIRSQVNKTRAGVKKAQAKMKASKMFAPIAKKLGAWLRDRFLEHFEKQGVGPRGGEGIWKARQPGQFYKGKELPPRPVLERSGAMKRSMTFRLEGDNLKFSFRKDYWVFHQYGKGRMYRPIFVMTQDYKRVVADSIAYFRITGEAKIIDSKGGRT